MDLENKYGTLEVQTRCVSLLNTFHHFCLNNEIQYSVAYGTLLGTVRHKGFIPWDDDIDVIMDRRNYTKLIKAIDASPTLVLERMTPESLWIDRVREKQDSCNSNSATLDLFLLDHSPDSFVLRSLKYFVILLLQGMMKSDPPNRGPLFIRCVARFISYLGKRFSLDNKYRWYQNISTYGNRHDTKYEQCYNIFYSSLHHRFKKGLLDSIVIKPFENIEIMSMEDYESFLIPEYGDYMTPPDDKRPKHIQIKNEQRRCPCSTR